MIKALRAGGLSRHGMKPRLAFLGFGILGAVGLSACSGDDRPKPPHPIVSPNAEILGVKHPQDRPDTCANALIIWFHRVDTNHDGKIDHAEFVADAEHWFQVVDADHNGFAEPAETAAIHAKLMPWDQAKEERDREEEEAMLLEQQQSAEDAARERQRRDRLGYPSDKNASPRRQPGVSIDLDPVMAADSNLDNRVSKDEFMAMADRHFDGLDVNHDLYLSQDEVVAKCDADALDWEAAEKNSRR